MPHKIIAVVLMLISLSVFSEPSEDKTIFYIDDTEIRESTFRLYYQKKGFKRAKNANEQKLQQIKTAQELINIYLLSNEAEQNNLDKSHEVIKELELARKTILMKAMVKKYSEDFTVTDDDLHRAYERMQQNAVKKAEFKIRNIVVDDEDQAKVIIEQLDKGSDFAALEKKFSKESFDKENKNSDWLNPDMVQPEMAKTITNLNKGQYTQKSIQTKFGWHVVLVEDKKIPEIPPLEKIRSELSNLIKQDMLREKIRQLRSKVLIKTQENQK